MYVQGFVLTMPENRNGSVIEERPAADLYYRAALADKMIMRSSQGRGELMVCTGCGIVGADARPELDRAAVTCEPDRDAVEIRMTLGRTPPA